MEFLINRLFLLGLICLFCLAGPLLNILGWNFYPGAYEDAGRAITRMHPATYLFGLGALVALLSLKRKYWNKLRNPWLLAFFVATIAVTMCAISLTYANMTGVSGGELSTAIVSFGTPAAMLLCMPSDMRKLSWMALPLRLFFLVNALMAITERVVGYRFIPSFLDDFNEHRSTALLGHPLIGALLTGLLLVNLIMSPKRSLPFSVRLVEILIQVMAMIAFGGRAALIFLPIVISAGALILRNRDGEKISVLQRLAPFALIAMGVLLTLLPIQFIDATLARFYEDNGSAMTRSKAIDILVSLDFWTLISGVDTVNRLLLMSFYNTNAGVELVWVNLILIFGLPTTILLAAGLLCALWHLTKNLDLSARMLALYFLVVATGSVSFSSKSLLIAQLFGMMIILCQQPEPRSAERASRRTTPPRMSRRLGPATGF